MRKRLLAIGLVILVFATAVTAFAQEESRELTITSREDFLDFARECRLDSYSVGLTVCLKADIDLTGSDFAGIPTFSGIFEGEGHTVSGLHIAAEGSVQGLFRYVTGEAVIRNLTVKGQVIPKGSRACVGGIAGENRGLLENCVFSGAVSGSEWVGGIAGINAATGEILKCKTEGGVQGSHFVGGITGENAGMIRSCENGAKVNTTAQQNSVDISDITLDSLTESELAVAVTDIGGIAGSSSGTVRRCRNHADVGYKHMGYNVGGICGSQTGYTTGCINYGSVSGRKDVGGIVGQLEPSVLLNYEADTLQLLRVELEQLSALTDAAVANAQSNGNNVQGLLLALENRMADAQELLQGLGEFSEKPTLEDLKTVGQTMEALGIILSDMTQTLRELTAALENTTNDLQQDLQAVSDQMEVVEAILENSAENLGGSFEDVSDRDDRKTLSSKVEKSDNQGAVLADLNAGGIAGAVAMESDLDPEEDVTLSGNLSLNVSGQIRAVILSCNNAGSVTLKRQNAGGIVGWQSLGLAKDCVNTGRLDTQTADYVGGIVGMSQGMVRQCSARCAVFGDAYVGGIAGKGKTVTDCRSIVMVEARESQGAVLGALETRTDADSILGNCYVPVQSQLAAVDGIDYDGAAQPVTLKAFLQLPGLDKVFRTVTVRFIAEDGKETVVTIAPGQSVPTSKIPEVASKTGFTGSWEGLEEETLKNLVFDMTFRVVYTAYDTVVSSQAIREDGRPLLLVQGNFISNGAVTAEPYDSFPKSAEKELRLESWQITVTGCETVTGGRLLVPADISAEHLGLYVQNSQGTWERREFRVAGSYLVFSLAKDEQAVALTQLPKEVNLLLVLGLGGAVLMAAAVAFVLLLRRRGKKQAAKTET